MFHWSRTERDGNFCKDAYNKHRAVGGIWSSCVKSAIHTPLLKRIGGIPWLGILTHTWGHKVSYHCLNTLLQTAIPLSWPQQRSFSNHIPSKYTKQTPCPPLTTVCESDKAGSTTSRMITSASKHKRKDCRSSHTWFNDGDSLSDSSLAMWPGNKVNVSITAEDCHQLIFYVRVQFLRKDDTLVRRGITHYVQLYIWK